MNSEAVVEETIINSTDYLEKLFKDSEDKYCHLKIRLFYEMSLPDLELPYICGLGYGKMHNKIPGSWLSGKCDGCGKDICPDCILKYKQFLGGNDNE